MQERSNVRLINVMFMFYFSLCNKQLNVSCCNLNKNHSCFIFTQFKASFSLPSDGLKRKLKELKKIERRPRTLVEKKYRKLSHKLRQGKYTVYFFNGIMCN